MKFIYLSSFFLFISLNFYAQKVDYSTLNIPENLKENANSIVVNQEINVVINSQKSYDISTYRVVKVLNDEGLTNIDAFEYYDDSNRIKKIDAKMYNSFGQLIRDFKQKDFRDTSVANGYSIISDKRKIYLDFTPTEYPFTIVYTSERVSENTAFIQPWYPINDTYESIVKSSFSISYPNDLGFKYKEMNFKNYAIVKKEESNKISYLIENVPAVRMEEYSPSMGKIIPIVLFGLEKFRLEGVEGSAKSWKDFGLWMNNSLLSQTEEINAETVQMIKALVGNETDPIKKARIVYKYVQDKTRYVSIQLGIGGWKPMLAKDVDRLGYGDCKALSNYTRSLLKAVDVPTCYTIIYGDEDKQDIQEDFVSVQGNHAVLTIPHENKYILLECTSQTDPFGFEGYFTDDRFALVVKPDGGEIIKTASYINKDNSQKIKSHYSVSETGEIDCTIQIKSKGVKYAQIYTIEKASAEKIDEHYKERFSNLVSLKINNHQFVNDNQNIEFTEKLICKVPNFATINGATLMFPLNAFNQYNRVPKRYRTRNNPLEIDRGFYDEDEIEITLPENYIIDAQPNPFDIKDKFGEYKTEITVVNPTKIIYKRSLLINKGNYDKTEYENFRKFVEQIAKADNSKILLTKKI